MHRPLIGAAPDPDRLVGASARVTAVNPRKVHQWFTTSSKYSTRLNRSSLPTSRGRTGARSAPRPEQRTTEKEIEMTTTLTTEQKQERTRWMAELQRKLDAEYGASVGRTAHAAVGTDAALAAYASVPLHELTAWQLGYEMGVWNAHADAMVDES